MKKSIILTFASLLSVLGIISCKDVTSDGLTGITYHVEIVLDGDLTYINPLGETYVEPGYSAYLLGEDVTDRVVVSADPDVDMPGMYTITYSATNNDGWTVSVDRTVVVYDVNYAGPDISGSYTVAVGSYRTYSSVTEFDGFDIEIVQEYPGFFSVECLIGKFYTEYYGYGPYYDYYYDFNIGGYLSIGGDNFDEFTLLSSYCPAWGDSMEALWNATYVEEGGIATLTYDATYFTGMDFHIILTRELEEEDASGDE